jgi:hypothetical protein
VGIAIDMVVVLIEGAPLLLFVPPQAFAAAALLTFADVTMGYWAGWPRTQDQKAIALASSLGNPALALALMSVSIPDVRAGALVAAYIVVRSITLAPIHWWFKRLRRRVRRPTG